jgi:hypothetical protein
LSEKDTTTSSADLNMPNQYAKVKNAVKGQDEMQDQTASSYGFIDEYLEDAIKNSTLYKEHDTDYEMWNSDNNV